MMKRTFVIIFLGLIVLLIPTVLVYTMQESEEDITVTDEPTDNNGSMESPETMTDQTAPDETTDETSYTITPEEIDIDEVDDIQAPQEMSQDTDDNDMTSDFSTQDQLIAEEADEDNDTGNVNYDESTDETNTMPDEFMENNDNDEE